MKGINGKTTGSIEAADGATLEGAGTSVDVHAEAVRIAAIIDHFCDTRAAVHHANETGLLTPGASQVIGELYAEVRRDILIAADIESGIRPNIAGSEAHFHTLIAAAEKDAHLTMVSGVVRMALLNCPAIRTAAERIAREEDEPMEMTAHLDAFSHAYTAEELSN